MKRISLAISLLAVFLISPAAEEYTLIEGDYTVNIPVMWTLYEFTNIQEISFSSPDNSVIMQVLWFEGDEFDDVNDMHRYYSDVLGAELLDKSLFPYLEWQAFLADSQFTNDYGTFRGYFLYLEGDRFDYLVIVFARDEEFMSYYPYVKSCLDSFSPGEEARSTPGVISSIFYRPENAVYEKKTSLLNGKALIYDYDPFELEASQLVIEREAPLLTYYQSETPEAALAWDRYYKLIYRDNYGRLDPIYEALKPHVAGMDDLETAEFLLAWLQGFEYGSSGTFSDLLSPLTSLVTETGDCDSLALAYLILLDHFGIDGILLVSEVYSHAMAGVAVERGGFMLSYGGTDYLVAEMTKDVDLGMIAADMADPAGWQPISFDE